MNQGSIIIKMVHNTIIVGLAIFSSSTFCFNIDTKGALFVKGPPNTYFGYSLVMMKDDDKIWLVVGAPKANFTDPSEFDIKTPGNVFKCKIDLKRSDQEECVPLNTRTDESSRWGNNMFYEEDEELLGASITLVDDKIITCAPRWKNLIPLNPDQKGFPHPVGRCFDIDSNLENTTYFTKQFKERDLGGKEIARYSQAGFSISENKYHNPDYSVVIGVPGHDENKGAFIRYNYTIPAYKDAVLHDYFTLQSVSARINGTIEQGSLIGYSITSGTLPDTGDGCLEGIILGAPHYIVAENIVGSVFVLCVNAANALVFKQQTIGLQPGGGFGHSIVYDDINGDGVNDLLVGAPFEFDTLIDTGAVHVYLGLNNTAEPLSGLNQTLKGTVVHGRFGTSIQSIGDVNKDGFRDVLIGSPYENEERGSIYLYHGGPSGLVFSQRIQAQDIDKDLQSFGWYISSSHDIDENNYTDISIGSYMSDKVLILRTRPIVTINNTLEVFPKEIPLNSSGLECQNDDLDPCVSVKICFSYDGPDVPDQILVEFNLTLDTGRSDKPSRLTFGKNETGTRNDVLRRNITIDLGTENCLDFDAVVKVVDRDFYFSLNEPLEIEVKYGLAVQNITGEVEPILDLPNLTENKDLANFSTGCGGICKTNLQVTSSLSTREIILDVTSEIVLNVVLVNNGEQSHSTWITVKPSDNVEYIGYYQPLDVVTGSVDCTYEQSNDSFIQCDLRQSLFNKQTVIVYFRFHVTRDTLVGANQTLGDFDQDVIFTAKAHTTGSELDKIDDEQSVSATTRLYSTVEISGASRPEQIRESDDGGKYLTFVHTYGVLNRGPSPLYNLSVHVCIPVTNGTGTPILDTENIVIQSSSSVVSGHVIKYPGIEDIIKTDDNTTRSNMTQDQELSLSLTQENEFSEMSCSTIDSKEKAIIEFRIKQIEKDDKETFSITLNISEDALTFSKTNGIMYKTVATVQEKNDSRFYISAVNSSYEIPSEIFPKLVERETAPLNLWIVVGGSVGGVVLLIILGIILWKCKFFERKKRQDVKRFKRQSGYYAEKRAARQSQFPRSTHITDLQNLNGNA